MKTLLTLILLAQFTTLRVLFGLGLLLFLANFISKPAQTKAEAQPSITTEQIASPPEDLPRFDELLVSLLKDECQCLSY